ncbi:MAG: hypothetical protein FWF43_04785 [Propionibacteriaceae bacterium]|nr:hypothetical protein [Propionibacteriaceae bacterium]
MRVETVNNGNSATVDPQDQIRMVQNLYSKSDPTTPLIHNDTGTYADNGKHFWNLAIRTSTGESKSDLYQQDTLYVDDPNVRQAMAAALAQSPGITNLSVSGSQISFTWGQ